jgi:hypothetical protein
MAKALDSNITMLITLDSSQSGGVHEKTLLDADKANNLAAFKRVSKMASSFSRLSPFVVLMTA